MLFYMYHTSIQVLIYRLVCKPNIQTHDRKNVLFSCSVGNFISRECMCEKKGLTRYGSTIGSSFITVALPVWSSGGDNTCAGDTASYKSCSKKHSYLLGFKNFGLFSHFSYYLRVNRGNIYVFEAISLSSRHMEEIYLLFWKKIL